MFDSTLAAAKTIAGPAAARALYDLAARAYAAGDQLEILAGRLARASWQAAAGPAPDRLPPAAPPINLTTPGGHQALLAVAAREGRVRYTPGT